MTKSGIECKYRAEKEFPFWLYDPEGDGLTFYRTGADRDRAAADAIALYLDTHDGWNEDVERVSGGLVTHHAVQVDREEKPANLDDDNCDDNGDHWPEGFDYKCDYKFKTIG
jgi:hypothetical protein